MSNGIEFKVDGAGVAAILKSAAVRAELESIASSKAREANARMYSNMPSTAGHDGYKASKPKNLTFTAISSVYAGSRAAMKDQEKHQTLSAINH